MADIEAELPEHIKEGLLKEFDKYEKRLWQKMPPARFSYWSKRELWTLIEFSYLLKGKEPLEKDDDRVDAVPASFVTHVKDVSRFMVDGILLSVLEPIYPYPDAKIVHVLLPPRKWLEWAKRKEFTIPDGLLHLLDSNEPETGVVENRISPSMLPGDLNVVVDEVNQTVSFCSQSNNGEETKYARNDIVGRGTVTWDLLVAFARCNGLLEGNNSADLKKMNSSVNRKNLGKNLMDAMNLDKSPIVEGRNGVMRFNSIKLAGGASSTDAMDRKTCNYDDQATEFLRSHGEDMSVTD
jgi:hypothetical protein